MHSSQGAYILAMATSLTERKPCKGKREGLRPDCESIIAEGIPTWIAYQRTNGWGVHSCTFLRDPPNGTYHPSADDREAMPSSSVCASLAIPSCRSISATSPYTRQALRSHPALQGGGEGGQALEQGQINTHAKQVPHSQTAASQSPSPLTCSSSGQPAVQAARIGRETAWATSVRRAAATLTARPGLPEGRIAARPLLGGADPASRVRVSSELRQRPGGGGAQQQQG